MTPPSASFKDDWSSGVFGAEYQGTPVVRDSGELSAEIVIAGPGDVEVNGWVEWAVANEYPLGTPSPSSASAYVVTGPIDVNEGSSLTLNWDIAGSLGSPFGATVLVGEPHVSYIGVFGALGLFEVGAGVLELDEVGAELFQARGYVLEAFQTYSFLTIGFADGVVEWDQFGGPVTLDAETRISWTMDSKEIVVEVGADRFTWSLEALNAKALEVLGAAEVSFPAVLDLGSADLGAIEFAVDIAGRGVRVWEWGYGYPAGTPSTVIGSGGTSGAIARSKIPQSVENAGLLNSGLI